MLELHKTIRLSHVVACPTVFILFYVRSCQGGVLKVVKNGFLVFLAVVPFSQDFGQVKVSLMLKLHKIK